MTSLMAFSWLLIAAFTILTVVTRAMPQKQQTTSYTSRFDNVDVDNILSNNRILNNYLKCLMEKGSCTPDGRELKKLLPDALASDCSKCTEVQKKNSQKVINYLRANRPGDWKLLLNKYDPNGSYRARHEQ